ncbi:MAG TPA: hypothetical protein VIV11_38100 [Kofleriaceae bacterium]
MNRWIIASCIAVAACQATDPQTNQIGQALEECPKGGNFPDATMPVLTLWTPQTQTPTAQPGQLYLDYVDPVNPAQHQAFIVDPGKGQITWGVIVKNQDMPAYRASRSGAEPMIGDCCRPPPPPIGGGDDWRAAFTLEAGKLLLETGERAAALAGPAY